MRGRTKVGNGAISEHDTEQQARDTIAAAVAVAAPQGADPPCNWRACTPRTGASRWST